MCDCISLDVRPCTNLSAQSSWMLVRSLGGSCALQEKPLRSPQRVGGAELRPGMQRPKQSYEFLGVKEVHVQRDRCVVMAQRLKGVARWAAFFSSHRRCQVGSCLSSPSSV